MFPQVELTVQLLQVFLRRLGETCPDIVDSFDESGIKSPAFTFGITVGVDAAAGISAVEAGAEIGVGISLRGERFCYGGFCIGKGFTTPDFSLPEPGVGAALTVFKDISNVPGASNYFSVSMDVDAPVYVNM